ncbi:MAG: NADH-quinone oxidoreductase subunit L [Nitrospinota bacterium]|jgi:NADH-quinone oxidoreductase subunit L|nr:NADH-quinone oxidoreductase subunit L [Nitrospinota bacterium]MDP6618827.1 NADH-quinone oxidoreductase subunit L [Nitrospinota bacterium]
MLENLWWIPLFPALGAVVNGVFGRYAGARNAGLIACAAAGLSFAASVWAFFSLLGLEVSARSVHQTLYTWIAAGDFVVRASFLFDPLSAVMSLVVTGVGFIIHVYSIGYMHEDPGRSRYFAYLNLFLFAMLLLVLADNFLVLFVGWEGVGLCSYLLIGFWFEKKSATDAGKKAFIVNRIGDFGFAIAVFLIFSTFGTLDYAEVFADAPGKLSAGGAAVTAITLLLFLGATGKSAQIPLYTWLPDAMEGPTPVSALIHAATMVTAGVYLVARTHVLFLLAPGVLLTVAAVGMATALLAALIALVQTDIKRVLAYSTISQLGYMFLACGLGAFGAAIFHLMTHAFFKALLFLGSGSVIHALGGEQDIRKMGGLRRHMPTTYWTFVIGGLALAGIFPLAGFFSKDAILWKAWAAGRPVFWGLGVLVAGMTAYYMFRCVFLTFHGTFRYGGAAAPRPHESPAVMTLPLVVLGVLAVIGGWVGVPIFQGADILGDFLAPVFAGAAGSAEAHGSVGLELGLMVVSLAVAGFGIFLAYRMHLARPESAKKAADRFPALHRLLLNKFYVDELYDSLFVIPLRNAALTLWRGVDVLLVDGLVNGVGGAFRKLSGVVRAFQTGHAKTYLLSMVVGVVAIALFYTWR